jgi:Trk K+ transport system NAD-binding subunit
MAQHKGDPDARRPLIVAGLNGLGLAVMEELRAEGAEVVAIGSAAEAAEHGLDVERLGARLTIGSARSPSTLGAAGLSSAGALVLTADDDTGNVESVLAARRISPDLPVVIRLFNEAMSTYLTETLRGVTALSTSRLAAPTFVERTERALAAVRPAPLPLRRARRRRRSLDLPAALIIGLLAFVVPSTIYFASVLRLRWIDALYFVWTTITTVGYGDITVRDAPDHAKVVAMVLMLAGAGFVAAIWALFAGAIIERRVAALEGRVRDRRRGHVIVVGTGDKGYWTTRALAARGHAVVIIDRETDSRNAGALRDEGHHVIRGDATVPETLELAGVDRAGVVLAMTESDATNLQLALAVRARGVPAVARLESPEISAHLAAVEGVAAASPIAIASRAFAKAALAAPRP